jgi:hypothetical protein
MLRPNEFHLKFMPKHFVTFQLFLALSSFVKECNVRDEGRGA